MEDTGQQRTSPLDRTAATCGTVSWVAGVVTGVYLLSQRGSLDDGLDGLAVLFLVFTGAAVVVVFGAGAALVLAVRLRRDGVQGLRPLTALASVPPALLSLGVVLLIALDQGSDRPTVPVYPAPSLAPAPSFPPLPTAPLPVPTPTGLPRR